MPDGENSERQWHEEARVKRSATREPRIANALQSQVAVKMPPCRWLAPKNLATENTENTEKEASRPASLVRPPTALRVKPAPRSAQDVCRFRARSSPGAARNREHCWLVRQAIRFTASATAREAQSHSPLPLCSLCSPWQREAQLGSFERADVGLPASSQPTEEPRFSTQRAVTDRHLRPALQPTADADDRMPSGAGRAGIMRR